jgi:hypothetical protein
MVCGRDKLTHHLTRSVTAIGLVTLCLGMAPASTTGGNVLTQTHSPKGIQLRLRGGAPSYD